MSAEILAQPVTDKQPRVFDITVADRYGRPFSVTRYCEVHGVHVARTHGVVIHPESHIRTLTKELWTMRDRIKVQARPVREGEVVECELCNEATS